MAANTQWNTKLKVGTEIIDKQHRVLFDLIHDFNTAVKSGASRRLSEVLLSVLQDYAFQHFQTEEECFAKHRDYTKHCLEHYAALKGLNTFILDYKNNRINGKQSPAAYLQEWLLEHIDTFDKPMFLGGTVRLHLVKDSGEADGGALEENDRRQHKRLPSSEVVDGEIKAHCYNSTQLRSGAASILDMSPGGLQLHSANNNRVDDLLIVSCNIGRNFKLKEKVVVKAVADRRQGVQFVAPSTETLTFFTNLYGSVHLNRSRLN